VLIVENGPCPDGRGAGSAELSATGGGFGLRGMRERIELVGGELSTAPAGAGWTVRAAVPR